MKPRPVTEYLYISTGKMDGLDEGHGITPIEPSSVSVNAPLMSVQLTRKRDECPDCLRRLKRLDKKVRPQSSDYQDSSVSVNGWIHFETEMHWGTMHPDQGPDGEDRVAVFTTCFPQPHHETSLILLGSTCHLFDRTGSVGRMGSSSDTLFRIVDNPHLLDTRENGLLKNAAESAFCLDRILTREAPRWQRSRLEGLAKVLHLASDDHVTKMVIATPLYVRISDPRSRTSRRNAAKRRGDIEKYGVGFEPGRR